jgi:hypothetical protein
LQNILSTVNDRKIQVDSNSDGIVDYCKADITSSTDYMPFGMLMPDRNFSSDKIRFAFNGKEKDDEIAGISGANTSAPLWEYDTRSGRRWNLDFVRKAFKSDYVCFSNNPIAKIDPNGNADYINAKGEKVGWDGTAGDGRVILVTDATQIKAIAASTANGQTYSLSNLKNEEFFELPPYDSRQEMKKSMEELQSPSFREIGGVIGDYKEYESEESSNVVSEGKNVMRRWIDGKEVINASDRAEIEETVDNAKDPLAGKSHVTFQAKWKWHSHPNGVFDENGNKSTLTFKQFKAQQLYDNSNKFGNYSTIDKNKGPSDEDYENTKTVTGIVMDQKDDKVYLYGNSHGKGNSSNLDMKVFYNIKENAGKK